MPHIVLYDACIFLSLVYMSACWAQECLKENTLLSVDRLVYISLACLHGRKVATSLINTICILGTEVCL